VLELGTSFEKQSLPKRESQWIWWHSLDVLKVLIFRDPLRGESIAYHMFFFIFWAALEQIQDKIDKSQKGGWNHDTVFFLCDSFCPLKSNCQEANCHVARVSSRQTAWIPIHPNSMSNMLLHTCSDWRPWKTKKDKGGPQKKTSTLTLRLFLVSNLTY
jgi:hypothetical protein